MGAAQEGAGRLRAGTRVPPRRAARPERPDESPTAAAVNLCMARRGLVVQTVLRVRAMRAFVHCAGRRPNI